MLPLVFQLSFETLLIAHLAQSGELLRAFSLRFYSQVHISFQSVSVIFDFLNQTLFPLVVFVQLAVLALDKSHHAVKLFPLGVQTKFGKRSVDSPLQLRQQQEHLRSALHAIAILAERALLGSVLSVLSATL